MNLKFAFPMFPLAVLAGLFGSPAQADGILARVISSTPVVQQVAVPRQYCNTAPVVTQSPSSGAGALMGALAGGALGNAVGDGGGRALATMIGLVGGAALGDNIEGPQTQVQNVQQCSTQTTYENRTAYYNVVYEYADQRHQVQMPSDPGLYVRLQVTPVGALPPAQPQAQNQPQFQPQPYQQYQQPATVYVQPPPFYSAPFPVVRPYYAPIGMSLNLGYSRDYGRHRHWR